MLHGIDLAVIAVYLAGITAFGVALRGSRRGGGAGAGLEEYFLASGRLPWWAIGFSIVAAETSVLTIISAPGLGFAGNFGFLQLVLGYLVARILIAWILIPAYFRGRLQTAYQLLEARFGPRMKAVGAGVFLIGRALAEGVRLYALAIVAGVILAALPGGGQGWSSGAAIGLVAVLTLVYTYFGGLRAVVWTDCIQIVLYLAAAGLSLWLIWSAPGVPAVLAAHPEKFRVFDFAWSWTRPYTFWAGLFGGAALTMATHGTDQLLVQRLLAARSQRESRMALLGSWVVVALQFTVFLAIGVGLYAYGQVNPAGLAVGGPGGNDRLYPAFVAAHFPAGLAGLALAAIVAAAMSNLSAALNALSSSTIFDFYRAHFAPGRSEAHYLRLARAATAGWLLVLGGVAFASRHSQSVLELGLTVLAYPFSAILGAFLLGTLTRRANSRGTLVGMACGVTAALALGERGLAFPWLAVVGTLVTFGIGYAVSSVWGPVSADGPNASTIA